MRKVILIFGRVGSGKTTLAKKLLSNFERTIAIDVNSEYEGTVHFNFLDLTEYVKDRNKFKAVLRPESEIDIEFTLELAWVMGDICVILEEASAYIEKETFKGALQKIVNFGRHRNISLIAIARRIVELHASVRSQYTSFVTFFQNEPNDLDRLESYGIEKTKVLNLKKFEYVCIGDAI